MNLFCRWGFHRRRHIRHSNLWKCLHCTGIWRQRHDEHGPHTDWEKVR